MIDLALGVAACVSKLREELAKNSSYSPYIEFEVGTTRFSTDSDEGYYMSIEHKKTGTGMANNFTINLAYCPNPDGVGTLDANLIDFDVLISTQECRFRYGYIFPDGERLDSDYYTGQILDYSIDIRDSMIFYTITGYSNVGAIKDGKLYKTRDELIKLSSGTYGGITYNAFNPVGLVVGILSEYIRNCDDMMTKKYVIVDETKHPASSTEDSDIFPTNGIQDCAIFEFVKSTLNKARAVGQEATKSDEAANEEYENLITYTFVVDDNYDKNPKIRIIDIDPKDKDTGAVEVIFNWMSGTFDDIVLNFAPDFHGSVAIATAKNALNNTLGEKNVPKYYVDSIGDVKESVKSIYKGLAPTAGDAADSDIIASTAILAMMNQDVYNASLTTIGIPADIQIMTHFQITPLIYGAPHHTAGEYYVTECTNTISTAGFVTNMTLFKVSGASVFKERLVAAKAEEVIKNLIKVFGDIFGNIFGSSK